MRHGEAKETAEAGYCVEEGDSKARAILEARQWAPVSVHLVGYSHSTGQVYQRGKCSIRLDDMSHLPTEITCSILGLLDHPDQVALALTCKHYMAMVASARNLPAKRSTGTRAMRLAVLVRLHDWMPPGLKLCYSCVKFVRSRENGPWHGDGKFVERKLASKAALENGPHCNPCYQKDQIQAAKAGASARRLKEKVRQI